MYIHILLVILPTTFQLNIHHVCEVLSQIYNYVHIPLIYRFIQIYKSEEHIKC